MLIGLGAVFTIGGIALLTPMSRLLGADETMLPVCVSYGRIVLLGLIPYMLQNTFQSFLVTAERPEWNGTATDLAAVLGLDIQPNALTKRLNVRAGKLLLDFHIGYTNTHIRTGSRIRLTW